MPAGEIVIARRFNALGMNANNRCARIAARQLGLIARAQALRSGLSTGQIYRRLVTGTWEAIYPRVFRLGGSPRSWQQSLLAAQIWAGAEGVVSHRAAKRLWGLDGIDLEIVELTLPRRTKARSAELTVHFGGLLARDVTKIGLFRVTTVTRTLLDLASVVDAGRLEAALDDALRRRMTTLKKLEERLSEIGSQGRRGMETMRKLINERDPDAALAESNLETRAAKLLKRSGLPKAVLQYEVREGKRLIGRLDMAYPEMRVAIELDGYRYHSDLVSWHKDIRRRNALTALGWTVIQVTWEDLERRPEEVVETVGDVLARRTAERGRARPTA